MLPRLIPIALEKKSFGTKKSLSSVNSINVRLLDKHKSMIGPNPSCILESPVSHSAPKKKMSAAFISWELQPNWLQT